MQLPIEGGRSHDGVAGDTLDAALTIGGGGEVMNPAPEKAVQSPPSPAPSMSPWKKVVYLIILVIVLPLSLVLITRASMRPDAMAATGMPAALDGVGRIATGILVGFFTVGLYLFAAFTCHVTFDYRQPRFGSTYKVKAFVSQILVFTGIAVSLGLIGTGVSRLLFTVLGIGLNPFLFGFLPALLIANLLMVRTNIWANTEVLLARRRLEAQGLGATDLARGTWLGISDVDGPPQRGLLEEDLGMLWIETDELVYRGDHRRFLVGRAALLEVERMVFGRSASAYAGNRHIVLRFRDDHGRVKRMRLHLEGCWTMSSLVTATDALAERLTFWQKRAA